MDDTDDLTDKQRAYVQHVASGMESRQAARAAGYSDSYAKVAARRLKTKPSVAAAIESIRTEGRSRAAYDLAAAMKEAESAAIFARQNKNSMALVKATELRAMLSGLLIDRVQEVPPVDLKGALLEARTRVIAIIDIMPKPSAVLIGARPTATELNGTPGTVAGAGSPKESG